MSEWFPKLTVTPVNLFPLLQEGSQKFQHSMPSLQARKCYLHIKTLLFTFFN